MKLVVLPYGQRALQGQTVNLPGNTSKVCSSLPKPLDNACAAEDWKLICSDAAPVSQTYFTVRSPYIIRALHWFKDLYGDIQMEELDSLDDSPVIQWNFNELELEEVETSVIYKGI